MEGTHEVVIPILEGPVVNALRTDDVTAPVGNGGVIGLTSAWLPDWSKFNYLVIQNPISKKHKIPE